MDSPVPGIPPWDQIVRLPALLALSTSAARTPSAWSRPRAHLLDRFWNEVRRRPSKIDEATRRHYAAIYARPGAMHSAFAQFSRSARRTRPTPQGDGDEAGDAGARHRRREGLRRQRGGRHAQRGDERAGTRRAERGHWLMEESAPRDDRRVQDFLAAH